MGSCAAKVCRLHSLFRHCQRWICEASRSHPRLAPASLVNDAHASRAGEMTDSRSPDRRQPRHRPPKSPIGHESVPRPEFVRRAQGPILNSFSQCQVMADPCSIKAATEIEDEPISRHSCISANCLNSVKPITFSPRRCCRKRRNTSLAVSAEHITDRRQEFGNERPYIEGL